MDPQVFGKVALPNLQSLMKRTEAQPYLHSLLKTLCGAATNQARQMCRSICLNGIEMTPALYDAQSDQRQLELALNLGIRVLEKMETNLAGKVFRVWLYPGAKAIPDCVSLALFAFFERRHCVLRDVPGGMILEVILPWSEGAGLESRHGIIMGMLYPWLTLRIRLSTPSGASGHLRDGGNSGALKN